MIGHTKATISCELCGNLYRENRKLRRHMKIVHLKVKNHKCNVCDRKFGTTMGLKNHKLAIHEKLKPFSCLQCDYRTAKYGNINLHRRKVHGLEMMPKPEYDRLKSMAPLPQEISETL